MLMRTLKLVLLNTFLVSEPMGEVFSLLTSKLRNLSDKELNGRSEPEELALESDLELEDDDSYSEVRGLPFVELT